MAGKTGVRYAETLVDWLNAHMDSADGQEVAHLVNWYNVERLEEDFPHPPHDVSEEELIRLLPRRLRRGLHGLRVDMHMHPSSWEEAQKLRSAAGSKLTRIEFSSGRYVLGIESQRDTWDGLGYLL